MAIIKQPPSIFNDVIGPVMKGSSSSHTAGLTWLCTQLPRELRCTGRGGVAVTRAGQEIKQRLADSNQE